MPARLCHRSPLPSPIVRGHGPCARARACMSPCNNQGTKRSARPSLRPGPMVSRPTWRELTARCLPMSVSVCVFLQMPVTVTLVNFLRAVAEACRPQRFREENCGCEFITRS